MDTRRFILAMTLSFAVLYGWNFLRQYTNPPQAPQTQPAVQVAATQPGASSQQAAMSETQPATTAPSPWHAEGASAAQTVTLGQDDPAGTYNIQAFLTSQGAAVERILMVGKNGKTRDGKPKYTYAAKVDENQPYQVMDPLTLPNCDMEYSWQTASIRVVGPDVTVPLANVFWNVETKRADSGAYEARFWVDVYNGQQPVVRVTKRFTLGPGGFGMNMGLTFQPLHEQEVSLVVDQLGALGIRREDPRSDMRKIYVVVKDKDRAKPEVFQHAGLVKKGAVEVGSAVPIWWTALVDKYFAAITAPDKVVGQSKVINTAKVFTYTNDPQAANMGGDIGVQMLSPPLTATTAKPAQLTYDLYVGPKTLEAFNANATYASREYGILRSAEYAWCTFSSLGELLTSFLHWLYYWIPPHNYGMAIIILVLLVRALLHPLTKHQQMSMAQMQQKQATVAPKIAAIKQKYANDRQKQQLETMKVYREAGINPAAQMAGCLPMVIQLPIWVALYSALNYDINLWHAPFLLWIKDLSAPDALIHWGTPVMVPVLSWMTGPVSQFNLLPVLLAVSMWLQQKYTPKPTPAPGTPQDQIDQQKQMQKMMSFMMVFMGIMFYNMPSGLNLYIGASSAFGALEQKRIRKHMEDQKKNADLGKPAKKDGWMEKLMEKVERKAAASHTLRNKDE